VRRYKKDSAITIRVELTANHRGYFEFRLCPNNDPKHVGTQACLDKYVLRRTKFAGASDEQNHDTRYYPAAGNKVCNKSVFQLYTYYMLFFFISYHGKYQFIFKTYLKNFKKYISKYYFDMSICLCLIRPQQWLLLVARIIPSIHST
jgi:hypothetical protein